MEGYLAECDLLVGTSERQRRVVVQRGSLTPASLATFTAPPSRVLYLRLVQQPLNGLELARWQTRPDHVSFRAPGRLARVGLFGRLVDAGFNASLLVRGTVPGGTAAAAQIKYAGARAVDPRYVYHGRVVRRNGWIVLHYLYFYFMNDYRSTFNGANDHEADWEQVFIYLEETPQGPRPVWIAAAAHDYIGDQLRRRWDDPTLVKKVGHPVVIFAGAGSHASYFEQGEYLTSVPLAAFRGLTNLMDVVREFWVDTLRQPDPGDLRRGAGERPVRVLRGLRARRRAGHRARARRRRGRPVLISDADPWVDGYRGLFGLDTHDRFGGERSPAGPKYNRTGTQRLSWHDPLGFAGLDKAAPPVALAGGARGAGGVAGGARLRRSRRRSTAADRLPGPRPGGPGAGADGGMEALHAARSGADRGRAGAARPARRRRPRSTTGWPPCAASWRELEAGELGDPRATCAIRTGRCRRRTPSTASSWSSGRRSASACCSCWWRASSCCACVPWWAALAIGVGGYVVIESAFRRRLTQLMLRSVWCWPSSLRSCCSASSDWSWYWLPSPAWPSSSSPTTSARSHTASGTWPAGPRGPPRRARPQSRSGTRTSRAAGMIRAARWPSPT